MISQTLEHSLSLAVRIAQKMGHEYVCVEHVLFALLQNPEAKRVLEACAFSIAQASQDLQGFFKNRLQTSVLPEGVAPQPSLGFQRILQIAAQQVISAGKEKIYGDTLLVAIFSEKHSHAAYFLTKQNLTRFDVVNFIAHGMGKPVINSPEFLDKDEVLSPNHFEAGEGSPRDSDAESRTSRRGESQDRSSNDPLALYTVDLCAKARQGKIDPLIGRSQELARTIHILCRRRKNNPLYVGDSGVGKTALAEGLANSIINNQVPEKLRGTKLYALDLTSLLAGTKFRGDFEQRMKALLSRLKHQSKAVLFIDEIHTLIGAGAVSGNSLDASNIIKPALASGELRCIGSTTFKEFRQHIENEHALARRFQRIDIHEPTIDESIAILHGLKKNYEEFHGVRFTSEAIRGAVELARHHMKSHRLPDIAIDIIDEAGAEKSLGSQHDDPSRSELKVQLSDIKTTIAKMAQLPNERLTSSDRDSLAKLGAQLRSVVFGQEKAVEMLERTIRISRSGLARADKPIGSFMFSGPTGVGKTELARQLATLLGISFLRFDMSEYMERHAVSRLIGAPPGYVGYDSGGLLTDGVTKHPYAVLLLDEIEKAHPDVHNILLQIMDHGTLTDSTGRATDFRNVILIMTTNVGAAEMSQNAIGFTKDSSQRTNNSRAIAQAFSPEFRNRLDGVVTFNSLAPEVMLSIVDKFLTETGKQLGKRHLRWEISLEARLFLARKGFDPHYGARPLARLIEEQIKTPLANILLFEKLPRNGLILITWDEVSDSLCVQPEQSGAESSVQELPLTVIPAEGL